MTLYESYVKGFRRILFVADDKGQRISLMKVLLLLAYLLGMFLLFVQFATVSTEDLIVEVTIVNRTDFLAEEMLAEYIAIDFFDEIKNQLENEYPEEDYVMEISYDIRLNFFGNIAALLNIILLVGILLFLIAEFTPLKNLQIKQRVSEFSSRSRRHTLIVRVSIILIIIMFLSLLIVIYLGLTIIGEIESVFKALGFEVGNAAFTPWLIVQPILLFWGLLAIFDLITQDYELGEKFGKKTISLLIMEFISMFAFFLLLFLFVGNLIPQMKEGVTTTYKLGGLEWVSISSDALYWLFVSILNLLIVVLSLIVGIFIIEKFSNRKKRKILSINVGIIIPCIVFLVLEILFFTLIETSLDNSANVLPLIILTSVLLVVLYKKQNSEEGRFFAKRKPIIPLLLLFGVVMIITKTLPALFLLEGRMKSLANIFDIVGFLAILFLSIFRVITLPETKPSVNLEGRNRFNPVELWRRIPIYTKILFLFYLSFVAFFMSLNSYAMASILSSIQNVPVQSAIQIERLGILAVSAAIGLLFVFFQYKPLPKSTTPGPLKILVDRTKEKFKEIDESILQKADDFLDH